MNSFNQEQLKKPIQGIFVSGLPIYSNKDKLRAIFSQFGEVKFVRIFSKKNGRKNQSFAKIKFESEFSVRQALKFSDKLRYEDRYMHINELKSQTKLEKTLCSKNKKIIYVNNLPSRCKKKEILDHLIYNGIPAKKVIRIFKRKTLSQSFETDELEESYSYGCILMLQDFVTVNINSLNRANLHFYDQKLSFSTYKFKEDTEHTDISVQVIPTKGGKTVNRLSTYPSSPIQNFRNVFGRERPGYPSAIAQIDLHSFKPTEKAYF